MTYPDIHDKDFNTKITKKFANYQIPKKKKTFDQICFPKSFELQQPQKFLSQYINPKTPYKGALVFHKIGSGKTCTAVNIGEQWKDTRNIIVVTPASLVGNFRDELRSKCAGDTYLTGKERDQLKKLHPTSNEYKEIIRKSNARIDKYYKIYSYNKFVELINEGKLNFNNSVLIIDEIQNMVSIGGSYYKTLYNAIRNAPKELRVILLSATPMFDQPMEIALTMNLIIPVELPTRIEFNKQFIRTTKNKSSGEYTFRAQHLEVFKERIKGYVSYYRGAPPYTFPHTPIKYVRCEMSDFQYKSYVTVLHNERAEKETRKHSVKGFTEGELLDLPSNFFLGARLISNVAFPNKNIKEKGMKSFTGSYLKLDNLFNYSIKFYEIINKINKSTGPVFVYSNFVEYGGIKAFAKVLEANGYVNYANSGEGRKRFAFITGNETADYKELIKNVYNQKGNINGRLLKVMLLSSSAKEGISFKNVRQAHILEPYWNHSRILQIIGRSSRYCSHKDLPEEKRNCKIYIYIATHPNERQTVDEYIMNLAKKKNKLIEQFETAMKEIAVDCELNKHANVYEELGETLKCDK